MSNEWANLTDEELEERRAAFASFDAKKRWTLLIFGYGAEWRLALTTEKRLASALLAYARHYAPHVARSLYVQRDQLSSGQREVFDMLLFEGWDGEPAALVETARAFGPDSKT